MIGKKLINKLPLTRIKIFLGRMLYRMLHLILREDRRVITRKGIKYEIDLSEGIDLSLFLFGNFQKHITENKYISLPDDAIIIDVGANLGAMALQFASRVPRGKVYAFEPTFYAFAKLEKNLELNPEIAKRISVAQSFVSSQTSEMPDIKAYASWKVGGEAEEDRHQVHGGTAKSTEGVGAVSLDDFCEKEQLQRLDFIKIDTDGHELEVLNGAKNVIGKYRPAVIFEIGIYVMQERGIDFSDYFEFFDSQGYRLVDSSNFEKLDISNYQVHIPAKGTIDILAMPK